MKKLLLFLFVGLIAALFSYQIFASSSHATNAEGFHDYLIPVKASILFFEKKATFFLETKEAIPQKIDEKVGWIAGIDSDANPATGGKWPKIGADYVITVFYQAGKWSGSIKNIKTQKSVDFNPELMLAKNKVDFSVPLSELANKTEFNWQIAIVSGENKKALPDLLVASKKNQKEGGNYQDYMDKNMKM